MKSLQDYLPTASAISIMTAMLQHTVSGINQGNKKAFQPGLIFIVYKGRRIETEGVGLTAMTSDQLMPEIEAIVKKYAQDGVQVLMIIFGSLATIQGFNYENPEEEEYGFLARGIIMDNRQLACFVKLNLNEEGYLAIERSRDAVIEVYDDSAMTPFEDDLIGTIAQIYSAHYKGTPDRPRERLH